MLLYSKVICKSRWTVFFEKCFSTVGIPYSPKDRHADVADVVQYYMKNGCFWCLLDNDNIIGRVLNKCQT